MVNNTMTFDIVYEVNPFDNQGFNLNFIWVN